MLYLVPFLKATPQTVFPQSTNMELDLGLGSSCLPCYGRVPSEKRRSGRPSNSCIGVLTHLKQGVNSKRRGVQPLLTICEGASLCPQDANWGAPALAFFGHEMHPMSGCLKAGRHLHKSTAISPCARGLEAGWSLWLAANSCIDIYKNIYVRIDIRLHVCIFVLVPNGCMFVSTLCLCLCVGILV